MIREMINLPKRQYLQATTTTTTAASIATSSIITAITTITKTTTSVVSTNAEDIEKKIFEETLREKLN